MRLIAVLTFLTALAMAAPAEVVDGGYAVDDVLRCQPEYAACLRVRFTVGC